MSAKIILLRHGQSAWNQSNLFTGWVDIPLSAQGIEECFAAGKAISQIPIDRIYTSSLIRAQMTVVLALLHHSSQKVPVFKHPGQGQLESWGEIYSEAATAATIPVYSAWELNERMYGHLQGLNKGETAEKFGAEKVQLWRRSFTESPPGGESLQMTAARVLPYLHQEILPYIERRQNILVAAHGNSLRAMVMEIEGLSGEEVAHLELATGEPRIYTYEQGRWIRDLDV